LKTASAIQVDDLGEAIVSGADDPDLGYISGHPFPITPGAFQTVLNPAVSGIGSSGGAFVLKLNAAGSALVFSTLFGGSDSLYTSDLKLDASGNVFVAGSTYALDLPTTAGAIQQCAADASSWQARGFVAEFSPDGSSLVMAAFWVREELARSRSIRRGTFISPEDSQIFLSSLAPSAGRVPAIPF
jgi:hypothetical protein